VAESISDERALNISFVLTSRVISDNISRLVYRSVTHYRPTNTNRDYNTSTKTDDEDTEGTNQSQRRTRNFKSTATKQRLYATAMSISLSVRLFLCSFVCRLKRVLVGHRPDWPSSGWALEDGPRVASPHRGGLGERCKLLSQS